MFAVILTFILKFNQTEAYQIGRRVILKGFIELGCSDENCTDSELGSVMGLCVSGAEPSGSVTAVGIHSVHTRVYPKVSGPSQ